MEKNVLLKVRDLCKEYGSGEGKTLALNHVNLDIYKGELLVLLGSSGSGKSTLLNLIGGIDQPTSGSIHYITEDICQFNDYRRTDYRKNKIGYVFQSFNLIQELNVEENISLTANKKKDPGIVEKVIELIGLSLKKKSYPSQLSGGEQQRVSIARALAKQTPILLCDEPTGALDYETSKQILVQIEKLAREMNKTVILVTHTKEIAKMGDRTIHIRNGEIESIEENLNPVSAMEIEW